MSDDQRTGRAGSLARKGTLFEGPLFWLCLFVFINAGFIAWWWLTSDEIAVEAGPIENLQMVFLFVAVLVFAYSGRTEPGDSRHAAIAMSIACAYLLLREMDFRVLPVPEAVRWLSTDMPRKVTQGLVLLVLAAYALRHFTRLARTGLAMGLKETWPYFVVFCLFGMAKMAEEISRADKNKFGSFSLPHGQFWEEMLELNADMLLLVVACLSFAMHRAVQERWARRGSRA